MIETVEALGGVEIIIEHKHKPKEIRNYRNTILDKGRQSIINFLTNQTKSTYVQNMLFGDGGMNENEEKRAVTLDRNSLYGVTRAKKPVIAQVNPTVRNQAIFTAVLTYDEANGYSLNEMALQLNDENLFSMVTFPHIGKTDQMQITYNWKINVI